MRHGILRPFPLRFLLGTLPALACLAAVSALGADDPAPQSPSMGNPVASSLMTMMEQEVRSGIKTRNIGDVWGRFQSYGGSKLDATAGPYPTSEITGNCRLKWYEHLFRNPLTAPAEAEQFTRELHRALCGNHEGLDRALATARLKMDAGKRDVRTLRSPSSADEAMEIVKQALSGAQAGYAASLAPLSRSEVSELVNRLYPTLTSQTSIGHTVSDRSTARRLCDLMERMDRSAMFDAADAVAPLANPELLKQLAQAPTEGSVKVEGATGTIHRQIVTPGGTIVIGGKGSNTYDLDKMEAINAIIDLGGNDVYKDGSCSFRRPVLIVLDLDGDDRYDGAKPGIQGGAVLGVSMLVDAAGNDVYRASDVAQGSALCGVGILVDNAGSDSYGAVRRAQGQAIGGVGLLIDRSGNDSYHAAMWDQGFGGPLGFGVLEDSSGHDRYYTGGQYLDSYPETPGYEGWGQGVGAGLRQSSNGGIGVILDGGGDDEYEYDYISHGGGYWLGLGFARDFGGNDKRFGGTRRNFQGGPRSEQVFQRFSCGFGCHYALGFCFDDGGDDTYGATIMAIGMAWDMSMGFLMDMAGNDRYEGTGGSVEGCGAQASLGVLFDYQGNDVYVGYNQGYANPGISYHPLPSCGGNFSFVIDYGGKDTYGCGVQDNSYNQRGAASGFIIDRPLPEDSVASGETETAEKPAAGQ